MIFSLQFPFKYFQEMILIGYTTYFHKKIFFNLVSNNQPIYHLNVTEEIVKCEIKKLNMNRSYGPDDIYPRLLTEPSSNISKTYCVSSLEK